jgi:hypothetical protein
VRAQQLPQLDDFEIVANIAPGVAAGVLGGSLEQ